MTDKSRTERLRNRVQMPDLVKLLFETLTLRKLLFNRLMLVFLLLVLLFSGGAWYVSANTTGVVEGTVVDEQGEPITDANITLRTASFGAVSERFRTTTNNEGEFRFENLEHVIEFRIIVEIDGQEIANERFHSYFEGQDRNLRVVVSDHSG